MSPTKRKVRILIWAPLGSGTHYWGPGISAYNLFRQIDLERFEVHLAHGYKEQSEYIVFQSQHLIRSLKFGGKISMVLFLRASYRWLKNNAANYDIFYCLSPHHIGILPSVWFKKFGGKKSFIKMTALNDGFNDNSFFSRILGLPKHRLKLAIQIDGFIALSKEIVEELTQVGIANSQIHKITNGVNINRFCPASKGEKVALKKKFCLHENQIVIVFTGGISKRKGPSLVLSAINHLIEDYPQLMLLIIGPQRDKGQEMERLQHILLTNPELVRHVRFIDHLPDIEEYYRASDLFILPSSNEGMSNSVLEALSCGLPAIVSPVSGSADMIESDLNGYIVPRSTSVIKEAILGYLKNPEKLERHGKRSRELVVDRFDGKKIIRMYERLFEIK